MVSKDKFIKESALNELAYRDYADYLERVHHGNYKHMPHTRYIAKHLQAIADGEEKHIIVELPPRSSKSYTITETFPSYFLGRNPNKKVIATAYSDNLARKFGRLNRNKLKEFGEPIFGVGLSDDNSNANNWTLDNGVGGMVATGIGGSITGEGADCFPKGTMIDTEIGKVDIKDLHEMKNKPRVSSYNHITGKIEYKDIQVTRRKPANDFTKISTVSGNEIISTKEHCYYDFERGYREANLFRSGDKLTVQAVKEKYALRCVQTRRKVYDNGEWSEKNQPSYSSHERRCNGQQCEEFNNAMYEVSHDTPQIESDTIQDVESYEQPNTIVYDIQVEDNHNFFANNLLVHNCLIIDDPIKNNEEAQSQTIRDKIWDEWETTLSTRIQKGGSVIVVMTRWHEDDIVGRLLERSPYDWERIRLPALAEENDLLGREIGEPLAPQLGYDEHWAELKKVEVGSKVWNSLYQQRPSASEGNIFKREWWQYYDRPPERFDKIIISWDLTFKDAKTSDYVVGQVWGKRKADKYLLYQVRDRMDFPTTLQTVKNVAYKYPKAREILIEDKANGPAVISSIKREVSGVIPINPKGSKVARAQSVTPQIESGNVFLPRYETFTQDLIEECAAFPAGAHDDICDCLSQALSRLTETRSAVASSINLW